MGSASTVIIANTLRVDSLSTVGFRSPADIKTAKMSTLPLCSASGAFGDTDGWAAEAVAADAACGSTEADASGLTEDSGRGS
jgi:hypothetical protein